MSSCLGSIELADGSRLLTRQLEQGDRSAVEAVFAGLSERSRHLRFGGGKARLSDRDLEQLTAVDHHDHEALVAFDERSERPVAIARFVRDTADPRTAEVAIAVADEWQGRAVGSRLVDRLVCRARSERIDRFRADVLPSNARAIALFKRLSNSARVAVSGGSVEILLELPTPR